MLACNFGKDFLGDFLLLSCLSKLLGMSLKLEYCFTIVLSLSNINFIKEMRRNMMGWCEL
jgi:hypothetical protein